MEKKHILLYFLIFLYNYSYHMKSWIFLTLINKKISKLLWSLFLSLIFVIPIFASDYTYYYGASCSHCYELDQYLEKNAFYEKYDIEKKEVYYDEINNKELLNEWARLGVPLENIAIPFLIYDNKEKYLKWTSDIINYFNVLDWWKDISEEKMQEKETSTKTYSFWKFLLILFPAALSDSINPCAFAVLFLLLSSILSKTSSFKKSISAGLLFSLAIFISYFLMGLGLYKVFSFSHQIFYIKLFVWILWVFVGIANIKDYFWYGKWFVMEVPFSWRPKMKNILNSITSPLWAFLVGFLISLFLLPCTSGPYFTVLGYLASENQSLNMQGYLYLFIYNLIFILPMIIITFIIGLGIKDISELKELRETHKENIHLIVGILMLLLWGYLLLEVLF